MVPDTIRGQMSSWGGQFVNFLHIVSLDFKGAIFFIFAYIENNKINEQEEILHGDHCQAR